VKDAQQILCWIKVKLSNAAPISNYLKKAKIYRQIYELQLRAQEEALGSEVRI